MKAGIITFHRAMNYGAVLQAFALQNYMISRGIETDIIDYRSPYIEYFYKPIKANFFRYPKIYIKEVLYSPFNRKKRKKFDDFIQKYIITSKKISKTTELLEIEKDYDFFIAGSDQIWNFKWNGLDKAFFLDFTDDRKKFSYAASFGISSIPNNMIGNYRKLLSGFQTISVREKSGKNIIESVLGFDSIVSVDPTCLLDKKIWEKIAKTPNIDNYILVYMLDQSEELLQFAKEKAREKNMNIVYLSDALKKKYNFVYRSFLSPEEFLGLFSKAEYVVTNSFHGLMFSIIFEKQFCIQYQKKPDAPNSRLIDFVEEFNLKDRVLTKEQILRNKIDFKNIKELIEKKKEQTNIYFENIKNIVDRNNEKNLFERKENCCGCRACEQICPENAIHMEQDQEGFLYPSVDQKQCIKCKLCLKVCAFKMREEPRRSSNYIKTLVGYQVDEIKRMNSRSGGLFVAFSDVVLAKKGVIYGASFCPDISVVHKRADNEEDRNEFCGSKYVQSDTENIFSQVYYDLSAGKNVLFSGTACQISGLKKFIALKKPIVSTEKLVTVDLICHGVVSPKIWKENLRELQLKYNNIILKANFRDKSFGWDSHIESYTMANGEKIFSERYTSIFYNNSALRPSCYNCPYSSLNRNSDITLADAWGINKTVPEWDSSLGVSLVFINTQKGLAVSKAASKYLTLKEVQVEHMLQPNFNAPTVLPLDRAKFWNDFFQYGYSYVADKCMNDRSKLKRKNKLKASIVRVMRMLRIK